MDHFSPVPVMASRTAHNQQSQPGLQEWSLEGIVGTMLAQQGKK